VGIKRALLLIVIGLIVQLFCVLHITPGTFLAFAGFGVGSVFVGLVLFGITAVRAHRAEPGKVDDA
jgi:multisubunit Na+/H+ antiporter MnhB subunit